MTFQPGVAEGLTIDTNGANTLSLGASANSVTFGGSNNPTYLFSGTGGLTVDGTSVTLGNGSSSTIQTLAGHDAGLTLLSQGLGNITLGQNAGNGNVVISPNAGGQAALIVKDLGTGDLFTASVGATTKFTVDKSGDIIFAGGQTNANSTINSLATSAQTYTLPNASGNICLSTNNCSFAAGTNYLQLNGNAVSPINSSYDFLLGGSSTSSAKFAFINNLGNATPVASISAQGGSTAPSGLALSPGAIQSLNDGTLTIGGSTTGNLVFDSGTNVDQFNDNTINLTGSAPIITSTNALQIATAANNNLSLMPGGTGDVGINVSSGLLGTLDVRGNTATTPAASVSAASTFATLDVNNNGSGDLFTASKSGATKFVIDNNGNLQLAGTNNVLSTLASAATSAQTWTLPNASGTLSLGTNEWQQIAGALSPTTITDDMLVGGTSTASARFTVINMVGAGTPTASLSANNGGNNAAYLTGAGTLGTTNGQSLTLGSTGNVDFFNTNNVLTSAGNLTLAGSTGINLSGSSADINFTGTGAPDTITTNGNDNLALMPGGSGQVGVNVASNLLATLDVRGNSGTAPVASVSGATTNAAEIVDQSGSGDIFTASKSGQTQFVINNDGTVSLSTSNYNACGVLATDANGNIYCSSSGDKETIASVYTITAPSGSNLHINFNGAADSVPSSASGTITFPANTTKISVSLKGAGGGGGGVGGGTAVVKDGGGGGEGGYSTDLITNIATDYYVKVGGGGIGGATTGTNGGLGTQTCLGTNSTDACSSPLTNATGGSGGTGVTAAGMAAGGAAGVGAGGNINLTGQPGFNSSTTVTNSAWGGAGGGVGGALSVTASGNGTNGVNGGGGSGGADVTAVATTRTGGNGGNGYITFTIYTNSPTVTSGDGWYQYGNGVLAPINTTSDVLIGSNATASAKFGFINVNNGTPTASLSASVGNNAAYLTGTGVLGTTDAQTLQLGSSSTGNISFVSGAATAMTIQPNGSIGIGTANPLATLDVRGNSATTPAASVSAASNFAAMLVDNSGTGDLFTASKSGASRFVVDNNGNLQFSGTTNFLNTITTTGIFASAQTYSLPNAGGTFCLSTNNCGFASGNNYWQLLTNALSPGNSTYDFLLGGNSTASAKFAFLNNAGSAIPVASISAQNGPAPVGLVLSPGNIQSLNDGTLTIGGNTTGNIVIDSGTNVTQLADNNINLTGTAPIITSTNALQINTGANTLTLNQGGSGQIQFFGTNNFITSGGALTLNGTGNALNLSGTTGANINFSGAGVGQIITAANQNLALMPGANGDVGLNASSGLLAALDVRGNTATTPGASVSATSTFAALDVNNNGTGDLFTASKSGATKFTILNNGNIAFAGTTNFLTTLTSAATQAQTITLPAATGGVGTLCLQNSVSCGFATGTNEWQQIAGAISPTTITDDMLVGGTSTASARFAITNMVGAGTPTASLSAGVSGGAYMTASGVIQTTANQTLSLGGTTTGNILLNPAAGNFVGIDTTNPLATLDVRGATGLNGGTVAVASVSGQTSFASLVVNNSGTGDLFTASKSGATKFVVDNNGNIQFAGTTNFLSTLASAATAARTWTLPDATGTVCVSGQACATSGTVGYLQRNAGAIAPAFITDDLLLGSTATSSAKFAVINMAGGTPVASLSAGVTGGAYMSANGAIQTTANQTLSLGGTTTGNIILNPASGNYVGIDTQNPLATLDVRGATGLNGGTVAVASVSGQTSYAALEVNNNGVGDIFTASKSGLTKFTITSAGNFNMLGNVGINRAASAIALDINGYAATNETFFADSAGGNNNCTTINNGSCNGLALGGTASTTGFISNVNGTTNLSGIDFVTKGSTKMSLTTGGNLGIGTTSPLAALDVRGNSASGPAASVSGTTSFAAMVVNNSGTGDLFTASSAGRTKFTVRNDGSIIFGGDTITASASGSTNNGSPDFINGLGDTGSLEPNSSFEASTSAGLGFADQWVKAATSSGALSVDGIDAAADGTNSIKATLGGNSTVAFYGACIPLSAAGVYQPAAYVESSAGRPVVSMIIEGFTSKSTCVSDTSMKPSSQTANSGNTIASTWTAQSFGTLTPGANTQWGRLRVQISNVTATTVNIDGVRLIESALSGGLDYAEDYPADPNNVPQPGDVVALESSNGAALVTKADSTHQSVLGVVSTKPGEELNDGSVPSPYVPIALAGRIPVNVSTANGSIHTGDYLTASSIPGVAVKATSAGQVIGTAMEDFDCTTTVDVQSQVFGNNVCQGQVTMFVNNTYYDPTVVTAADGNYDLLQNSDLSAFDASSSATASASGSSILQPLYTIQTGAGVAVTATTAFAQATIANVQAGAIVAKEISTDSLNVTTGNIMIGGQTLDDYIKGIVKQTLSERDQTGSVVVSVNGLVTATQSAQLIQNMLSQKDLSATVSAMTVSGVLGADTINARHIAGLTDLIATTVSAASMSAQSVTLDTANVKHIVGLTDLSATTISAVSISAQTITADTIDAKHIAGLDILTAGLQKDDARITALENLVASPSAAPTVAQQPTISPTDGMTILSGISDQASVSGDLRVKGNGLIEGILHVVDTLFTNNIIVNGVSDFFGNVIFHSGVTFQQTPTFNSDTAGIAVVKKGTDHVDVTFSKDYDQTPVVNASITEVSLTPTPSETPESLQERQSEFEKTLLADNIRFVVTNRTVHGFTILLDKPADEDVAFSWLALSVL